MDGCLDIKEAQVSTKQIVINPSGLINLHLVRLRLAGASQRDRRSRLTGRVTQFGGRVQDNHFCSWIKEAH